MVDRAMKGLGMATQDFLNGKLLIAMPNMTDPRFTKSIVLLCSHDEDHAMGVVVNKPLRSVELGELLDQLAIDPRPGVAGEPVYYGGPVRTERGLVVHSLDYCLPTTMRITTDLGLTGSQVILSDIASLSSSRAGPAQSRLVVGHAGWGPAQLESELAANAWAHCDAASDLIFLRDGDDAWRAAMETLGVTEAMFSSAWSETRRDDGHLN
ncbi:MAG: hypothetical protein GC152_13825 [Alphaproteobacteria bacterium]|nr:hypothetical protein [Alphaproteobacteria bacterium]